MRAIGDDVLDAHVIEPQRLFTIVLDDDQQRQKPIAVGIDLPERLPDQILIHIRNGGNRDILAGLFRRITGSRAGREMRLFVASR